LKRKKKTWEEIRSKGQLNFILTQGIIGWGVPVAILVFFITRLLEFGINFTMYFNEGWGADLFTNILAYSLVGGVILGWWLWKIGESKYQETEFK
jgi:hypothetical protein